MNMFKSKSSNPTPGGDAPGGETGGAETPGKEAPTDGAEAGKGGDGKGPEIGQMKPGDYMIHVGSQSLDSLRCRSLWRRRNSSRSRRATQWTR